MREKIFCAKKKRSIIFMPFCPLQMPLIFSVLKVMNFCFLIRMLLIIFFFWHQCLYCLHIILWYKVRFLSCFALHFFFFCGVDLYFTMFLIACVTTKLHTINQRICKTFHSSILIYSKTSWLAGIWRGRTLLPCEETL